MTKSTHHKAGVWLHLTSLPGRYGVGDIGRPAHEFMRTLRRMGMRVWQFLPLGPVGYGNSPYQPLSVYAGNEMLIGLEELVNDGFLVESELVELEQLSSDRTDYEALVPLKTSILQRAAGRFENRASAEHKAEFERFLAEHDGAWLHTYALFCVLKSLHGGLAWTRWSSEYRRRENHALKRLSQSAQADINGYKVQQFWFYRQWAALKKAANASGLELMGDIPIYIALDSADAWSHPELLAIDQDGSPTCVAGVPPDYFSEDGQLWGNPVYDWRYHERTGYRWWIDRLQAMLNQVDMIRLDHFRGFESYWSIPAGAQSAREGQWLKGPADKLFEALRQELGNLPLIAEDLGIITDEVREFLARWDFPGMSVLQFMVCEHDFSRHDVRPDTVCYTGTHDNDTSWGWFNGYAGPGESEKERAARQDKVLHTINGRPETVHHDLVRFALSTDAKLCMFPMQDLLGLGSEARMNTPGTTEDNWTWRLSPASTPLDDAVCDRVFDWVSTSGRTT